VTALGEVPAVRGLVTVVVPAYQRAAAIGPALRSVTTQTYRDLEVLVVDDGSTDATPDVVAAIAADDPRVRLIRFDENQGRSAARNAGIEAARGEFVTFLDSDDLYAPTRIERLVAAARRHSGDEVFVDDVMQFARKDGRLVLRNRTVYPTGVLPGPSRPVWIEGYLRWSAASKLFLRRSLLESTGARFPTDLDQSEDRAFLLDVLFCGTTRRAIRVCRPLYWYHRPYEYRADAAWLLSNQIRAIEGSVARTGNPDLARLAPRMIAGMSRNPDDGDPRRRFSLRRLNPQRVVFIALWVLARVVDAPIRGRLRRSIEQALEDTPSQATT
jgi:glycosyltransferase involved in cell wall biosynthesis